MNEQSSQENPGNKPIESVEQEITPETPLKRVTWTWGEFYIHLKKVGDLKDETFEQFVKEYRKLME